MTTERGTEMTAQDKLIILTALEAFTDGWPARKKAAFLRRTQRVLKRLEYGRA